MDIQKVIKFFFNPTSGMSLEEIEGKKHFPFSLNFINLLAKLKKLFIGSLD